jgi:hypothetical protein
LALNGIPLQTARMPSVDRPRSCRRRVGVRIPDPVQPGHQVHHCDMNNFHFARLLLSPCTPDTLRHDQQKQGQQGAARRFCAECALTALAGMTLATHARALAVQSVRAIISQRGASANHRAIKIDAKRRGIRLLSRLCGPYTPHGSPGPAHGSRDYAIGRYRWLWQ